MTSHLDPQRLAHLQTWQGRSETLDDLITPAPLRALSATLDRDDALPVVRLWAQDHEGCLTMQATAHLV